MRVLEQDVNLIKKTIVSLPLYAVFLCIQLSIQTIILSIMMFNYIKTTNNSRPFSCKTS